ncbi:hypothetical protein E1264_02920 [Actinomadura sp. KC216]|nr:hypothetical protein E1264_02920 [Actinomadura sp. KC216]
MVTLRTPVTVGPMLAAGRAPSSDEPNSPAVMGRPSRNRRASMSSASAVQSRKAVHARGASGQPPASAAMSRPGGPGASGAPSPGRRHAGFGG